MTTVRLYKNTSTSPLNVIGIGEIGAGDHASVVTDVPEAQPHVILSNYPGLINVTDEAPEDEDELDG